MKAVALLAVPSYVWLKLPNVTAAAAWLTTRLFVALP